jgi:hypothetical protein
MIRLLSLFHCRPPVAYPGYVRRGHLPVLFHLQVMLSPRTSTMSHIPFLLSDTT